MSAVSVTLCLLAGLVLGAASAEAQIQHHPVAAVLVFALAVGVSWVGVTQL